MKCGVWVPAVCRAARFVHRGGNGEKFVALHINVLGLRAVINGVLWRLRSASNIHSKGVHAMDLMVILGALAKGRSTPRRLAPLVMKLVVAASFTPLLVYCGTDLNPVDGPSRHGQESSARRPGKGAQEATMSDY